MTEPLPPLSQVQASGLLKNACLINGRWQRTDDQTEIRNPSNGALVGTIPVMGETETQAAIDAAEASLAGWSKHTARQRANILRRWFELIHENKDVLAQIMTLEQGKPFPEAVGEIVYAASFIEWFAEEAPRIDGSVIPSEAPDRRVLVLRQPIGVVAAITPWNFPSAMITRKCAPALAAGCTVVIKPAQLTPFSALALGELACRAGFPDGVLNVITGNARSIGTTLTSSPKVRKVTFTGSTAVGKTLMSQSAETVKKVSLELGGNAPFLVFDDADLPQAVQGAMVSKFRNAGQTCVCANRILVHEKVHDRFLELLADEVRKLKVGDGFAEGVTIGPLINDAAAQKVEEHIQDAVAKGAKVVVGGKRHALGGRFFEPTVVDGVTPDMQCTHEETFGPLAPVITFHSEDEAVAMANDTPFGLASYVYTRDLARSWRLSERLEFGIVGVNVGIISTASAPFGGVKESGIGREGSRHGIDEFVEMKYVCVGGLSPH